MKITIVIPTLNESKYLPKLLESIKQQDFPKTDYEIIVADAISKDNTQEIAKSYGAKVVSDKSNIATGRNNGAKAGTGEYILFLDSDVELTPGFLSSMWFESQSRNIRLGTTRFLPNPASPIDNFLFSLGYWYLVASSFTDKPSGFGFCIWVKRDVFEYVNGFNQELKMEEDNDFTSRASKIAPLKFFKNSTFLLSTRRYLKEGRIKPLTKYLLARLRYLGYIKNEVVEEFGNHQ